MWMWCVDGCYWMGFFMIKFELCVKGVDCRGVVVVEDVFFGDVYDVFDDGVEVDVKIGELCVYCDDDEMMDVECVVLVKVCVMMMGVVLVYRVFVDVVKIDVFDVCELMVMVVMEFYVYDEDLMINAARALEWFDNAFETRTSG